jgi:hypothetical protein
LDLRVPYHYAKDFIRTFELHLEQRGFAVDEKGVLLSPQEYQASLSYLSKVHLPKMHFTFVGGCFPVQGDINFEDLFHQVIRKRIEETEKIRFEVSIIRYERFANTLHKISKNLEEHPIDVLTLSIRPEPFLRLVKLYYRFYDQVTHSKKWSFNLPWMNLVNPEKLDLLANQNGFPSAGITGGSFFRRFFRHLNYLLGAMLGNENFAWKQYEKLIKEMMDFCNKKNIQFILLGPPVSSKAGIEAMLSRRLVHHVKKMVSTSNIQFANGTIGQQHDAAWFEKNGIYAKEEYHEIIANRLYRAFVSLDWYKEDFIILNGMRLEMPIPQAEMDTNSLMEQNAAYQ